MGELDELFEGAETDLEHAPERPRLESERQADARVEAKKHGWHSWKTSSPRRRGFLDVVYVKAGVGLAVVEYKVPPRGPSELQQGVLDKLTEAGVPCAVCYDIDDTMEFLNNVEKGC